MLQLYSLARVSTSIHSNHTLRYASHLCEAGPSIYKKLSAGSIHQKNIGEDEGSLPDPRSVYDRVTANSIPTYHQVNLPSGTIYLCRKPGNSYSPASGFQQVFGKALSLCPSYSTPCTYFIDFNDNREKECKQVL